MSTIPGGATPVAVPVQETLPRPAELRNPVAVKTIPKGEAAARYQAEQNTQERNVTPDDLRGQRVDVDA